MRNADIMIISKISEGLCAIAGMMAANQEAQRQQTELTYLEQDFMRIPEDYGFGSAAVKEAIASEQ